MSQAWNHRQKTAHKRGHDEGYWHDFDYARMSYYDKYHSDRRARFVKSKCSHLHCMECGGAGEEVNDSIDFGGEGCPMMCNIYIDCGWCDGTGLMTPHERGQWLRMKKEERRERND